MERPAAKKGKTKCKLKKRFKVALFIEKPPQIQAAIELPI
jgi:hypothetical protein